MKERELKIPPGDAKAIGARLRQQLRRKRLGHPETADQQWLAGELDLSTAMVSRMINHGHGSFAGWREACKAVGADMHYVAFGITAIHKADEEFSEMLKANQSMNRIINALRTERDDLLAKLNAGR